MHSEHAFILRHSPHAAIIDMLLPVQAMLIFCDELADSSTSQSRKDQLKELIKDIEGVIENNLSLAEAADVKIGKYERPLKRESLGEMDVMLATNITSDDGLQINNFVVDEPPVHTNSLCPSSPMVSYN